MSELDRIINIQIDRQTTAVSQKGFGTMLLVADEADKPVGQTSRVRVYDADSFKDDFAVTDATYIALLAYFSQVLLPEQAIVGYVEGAETVGDALTAISEENDDWYALALTSRVEADQEAAAAYIQSEAKICGLGSAEANILSATTPNIANTLFDNSYSRSYSFYNAEAATKYPECAWFGRVLPALPGSITWKFKTLSGIIPDALSGTARTNIRNVKGNYYNRIGGVSIAEEGWMGDGSFIDEIRGVDFIKARMQEAIYARLVNLPKVPYTNAGADIIVNEMEAVLKLSESQGILVPGLSVVTKPNVRDLPFNDKATRNLPNLTFRAILQGAVHRIEIRGVVTL